MRDIQMKALNKHLQKVKELQAGVQEVIKSNKDRISPTLQNHFHTRVEIVSLKSLKYQSYALFRIRLTMI